VSSTFPDAPVESRAKNTQYVAWKRNQRAVFEQRETLLGGG